MTLRSAAMVAALALSVMSSATRASQITYQVDFTSTSPRYANSYSAKVTGTIVTDGRIGALENQDIESVSITSNGITGTILAPYAFNGALVATADGFLQFDFFRTGGVFDVKDSEDEILLLDDRISQIHALSVRNANGDIYTFQPVDTGSVFNLGTMVTSVPLPSSAAMFGAALLGLAGLGHAAKRRKAAAAG